MTTTPVHKIKSLQLARLWQALEDLQQQINSTLLPLMSVTGTSFENPNLADALEATQAEIDNHLAAYHLQATPITNSK